MNNIVSNFDQILSFAREYGLPFGKKRAILREYLQVKILSLLYQQRISSQVFFIGGTSLRLLRGLDRFSEDLDFDLKNVSLDNVDLIMKEINVGLKRENIDFVLYKNITARRIYFEIRFKNILAELKLSTDKEEKLTVKFDFEKLWLSEKTETILLNRYGFLVNVLTLALDQILVQKLAAYLFRKETQPRDIYDIVWLLGRGAKVDLEFLKSNQMPLDIVERVLRKFEKEKQKLKTFKLRLRPFLINEENAENLVFLPELLHKI